MLVFFNMDRFIALIEGQEGKLNLVWALKQREVLGEIYRIFSLSYIYYTTVYYISVDGFFSYWVIWFYNKLQALHVNHLTWQEITRANKGWALDRMVLCNEVTKWMKDDVTQPPAEGVYVYGLYLEGAGWDRRNCKLIDSKPKVLFEMMPVVRMYAENNGKIFFFADYTLF